MTAIRILRDGLWHNNAGIVQLLGLCPLLAVSNTAVNALGLGAATLVALVASNVVISTLRHWVPEAMRIPVYVLVIACAVTVVELFLEAFFFELHRVLGIFVPLIVTNCAILARAEAFASRQPPYQAMLDGLAMGFGFALVLLLLGGLREVVGFGTLFRQAELLFGAEAGSMTIVVAKEYPGMLLAILPPGAFLGLAGLVALKNTIDARGSQARAEHAATS